MELAASPGFAPGPPVSETGTLLMIRPRPFSFRSHRPVPVRSWSAPGHRQGRAVDDHRCCR